MVTSENVILALWTQCTAREFHQTSCKLSPGLTGKVTWENTVLLTNGSDMVKYYQKKKKKMFSALEMRQCIRPSPLFQTFSETDSLLKAMDVISRLFSPFVWPQLYQVVSLCCFSIFYMIWHKALQLNQKRKTIVFYYYCGAIFKVNNNYNW